MVIDSLQYEKDLKELTNKLRGKRYDCIVCLKRSGFIIGVYLSNKLTIPLFIQSEIKSIPDSYKNILIVDDKIKTGKSFKKIINKFNEDKQIQTASLYIEGEIYTDYFIKDVKKNVKPWYEN